MLSQSTRTHSNRSSRITSRGGRLWKMCWCRI